MNLNNIGTPQTVLPSVATPGTNLGPGGSNASGAQLSPIGSPPGVTAKTIKIGFIIVVNNDKLLNSFGVKGGDFGDSHAQEDAVVNDVNTRGGIFGRKIVPVYATYDSVSADSDETQYASLCETFTRDNRVFAVLAPWNEPESFAPCLAKAHVLYVYDALLQEDAETFARLSPYLYSSVFSLSRGAIAFARALFEQKFFAGQAKTGIIRIDTPSYERADKKYLRPTLGGLGVKIADEFAIRRGNISDTMSDVNAAVLRFNTEHINRVIFLTAAGGDALFFIGQAESQNYHPYYGLASPDSPEFLAANLTARQLHGSAGAGWLPGADVADAQGPPYSKAEKRCLSVQAKNGSTFATRNDALTAFAFCDMMWLFEEAARAAGSQLNLGTWAAGLRRVGRSHVSPYTFADSFSGAHADGGIGYRPLAYFDDCSCFRYTAPVRTIP